MDELLKANARDINWRDYIELPVKNPGPIKLDRILARRLKAFMRARKAKVSREGKEEATGVRND